MTVPRRVAARTRRRGPRILWIALAVLAAALFLQPTQAIKHLVGAGATVRPSPLQVVTGPAGDADELGRKGSPAPASSAVAGPGGLQAPNVGRPGEPARVGAADGAFPATLAAQLRQRLHQIRTSYPIPGLSAAVILADGRRWTGASGRAELGPKPRSVTGDTSFVIGSITKTFVAALVLQLAEEGRLTLDDRLSRWLPKYPNAGNITLRQLLNHTSGLYNYFEHRDYERLVFRRPTHYWTVPEILSLVGRPYFPPGTSYHYSNTNYVLLGLVAEKASGGSLGTEIRRRFLRPLALRDTYFQGEERVPVRAAMGYLYGGGTFHGLWDGSTSRPNRSAATVAWAAGAMVASAGDVATWAQSLYGGRVLQPASLAQMLRFGVGGYGLGARLATIAGQPAWGHAGSLRGFTAAAWYLPRQQVTVSLTTNRGRILPSAIAASLAQTVFEYLDQTPPIAAAPAEGLATGATLDATLIPVRLAWSARDELSGIRGYELQQSVDAGPWSRVSLSSPLANATTRRLQPGRVYGFRVRAVDRAGNTSAWAAGPTFGVSIDQETSRATAYRGTWTRQRSPAASGASVNYARAAGAAARFTFTGSTVAWVASTGRSRGRADVYVDGVYAGRTDLRSATAASRRIVFARSWPGSAAHSLEIRVAGTPSRPRVDVDAFAVLIRVPTGP